MSFEDMTKKEILEDYTTVMNRIINHIEKWPKKIPAWNPTEDYTGFYVIKDIDSWLDQLKIIVGFSVDTHETRSKERE